MKKIIILGSFALSFLMIGCGGSDESTETISEEEKTEILELEIETEKLEEKQADIDASTKELEELLEEL
jgi:hypothetical protein